MSPVEARENEKLEVGMIAVDAIYSPVKNVSYEVTNTRVGQITNFNKLTITMETDGTISGSEAINIAAHILVDHFALLIDDSAVAANAETSVEATEAPAAGSDEAADQSSVKSLNLSVRARNALEKNGINFIEQLQALTDDEIKGLDGLGEKSINEIFEVLGRTA